MRFIILVIAVISFNLAARSQDIKDSVAVYGNVSDSFTYEQLKGVHVEILRADSSLIYDFHTDPVYGYGGYRHNIDKVGYLYVPRETCLFRFTKEGYLPQSITLEKKHIGRREKRVFLGEIHLKRVPRGERDLGEAVVSVSKIRMVVKGDTLVYNADAFQLAEGSMLDGLIKRLPGFKLQGGQIRVNGEYVSSLLVNGEEFFRGDPRVALENLPAYMVDKVKVYHKEHEYSYITKERDKKELPLVVDVNLKRQYAIGWVANVAAAYGLAERYQARLFALRFTDNSRLAVYGNANNTNDTRQPGVTGDWKAQGVASGRTEMQTGGFEVLVKDKKGVWKYTGNAQVAHRGTDDRSIASTETFQPGWEQSTFSRINRGNTGNQLKVQTDHQYTYRKTQGHLTLTGHGAYQRNRNRSDLLGAEFMDDPKDAYRAASLDSIFLGTSNGLAALLLHKQREQRKERSDYWNGNIQLNSYIEVPHTPDYINFSAHVRVDKQEQTSFSDYFLHFNSAIAADRPDDHRRRYTASPSFALDAAVDLTYNYRPDWGFIKPHYIFKENYRNTDLSLYRLDRLEEGAPEFGELPSSVEALMSCLDAPNSFTSRLNTHTHRAGAELAYWLPGKLPSHRLIFTPEVEWRIDHLVYHRDMLHTKPRRSKAVFMPSASWGFENCYVNYKMTYSYPDLLSLLRYTDNSDPLNVYKGNPDLKRSIKHSVDFSRSFGNYQTGWHFYLKGGWNMTHNAIAHAMHYDADTGIRTFSPRNVNGNWGANLSGDYQKPLDREQRFILTTVTDFSYRNSVDYVTERSTVRNLNVGESLHLNARFKQAVIDLNVAVNYLHASSPDAGFQTINSFDFKYSASAQLPLPAGFALSTDLTLYQRTGYTDKSLNDCRFVANARLSKTWLGGRLGLTLDAFDIFHGLSHVTKTINAQGITETWYNSLPSYAVVQIAYKFSKQPKKK